MFSTWDAKLLSFAFLERKHSARQYTFFGWVVGIRASLALGLHCTSSIDRYAFLYDFYLGCQVIQYISWAASTHLYHNSCFRPALYMYYVLLLPFYDVMIDTNGQWYSEMILVSRVQVFDSVFFFYIFCDVSLVISEFILLAMPCSH
jgi:hypothetical protein